MKKLLSLLVVLALFVSCKNEVNPPVEDAQPIKLTAVQKQKVVQDNDFAFELMKQVLAETDESNVFISPLSVSIALGMTWNGAIGDTKTEMEKTLKMNGMSVNEINEYYKLMQTTLPGIDPLTKLSIANSIWYRDIFDVKPDFLQINKDYFNAEVSSLDFDSPDAPGIINKWCSDKTNGLIPKVIEKIKDEHVMFLINAIYFKGIWVKQFKKDDTCEGDFINEQNQSVKVNFMNMTDTFAYAEDEYAQYLEMPYGNKAFSMTVILPKKSDSFSGLTSDRFNKVLEKMTNEEVAVMLPRFKVKNKFQLKPMLQAMGMQKAFIRIAEFDGMSNLKPLYIDFVQHDTYVEVTEEGTEAAAVTTVAMQTESLSSRPYFIANKPFAFVIKEKSTGIILFMGKMGSVEKF
ncbi:MAG TPA: serpin family protein [Bacteroidales bacterium]|nr:serpin family protein [Bacteroidales bacterium]